MKINKYFIIPLILLAMLVLMELFFPKPVSWEVTLSSDDKIPYGTYILKKTISPVFIENQLELSRKSFYEMQDSSDVQPSNYLVIAETFQPGKHDIDAMLKKIEEGSHVLISSYLFGKTIYDSLGIKTKDVILDKLKNTGNPLEFDSTYIQKLFPDKTAVYYYKYEDLPVSFSMDSASGWEVHAWNENDEPVLISMSFGEGRLILNSTPLIFTNIYLLKQSNHKVASMALSLLPELPLHWSEFYSRGRGEPQTPLRYILSTLPLKWAYYVLIFSVLFFILFEAKRKQRPIRVLTPPRNDSLDFIKTIGNLYFEKGDHKNMATKKITHLLEYIRAHHHLPTNRYNTEFFIQLSNKSGKPLVNIEALFTMIEILNKKEKIVGDELLILNRKIEALLD